MNPPSHNPIACGERLNEISGITRTMYLERLAIERLQRKSQAINQMLDDCKGGWETCCYWLFAHYFGGTANAFPFELMAKSTPMTILARYKGDKTRIEALLMGQSGLLEAYYEDDYPRMLQCEYETLRKGFSLSPISAHLWKFFRLRPSSFPTLRISQFASLISSSSNLFSKLLDTTDAKDLTAFFNVEATEYWKCHYQFDKPTKESAKKVGEMLSRTLIINAWVPLLFVYGSHHGMDLYKDRAIAILQQLPPEHNSIINHWKSHGIVPQSAAESQALIQLYNNYCNDHRCLDCQIGYKVLSK